MNVWFIDGHIEHMKPSRLFSMRDDALRWTRRGWRPIRKPCVL
jgi:hypothetical protein